MSTKKEESILRKKIEELKTKISKFTQNNINTNKIKELELQVIQYEDQLYELSS